MAAGFGHSLALTRDGNVSATGYNEYGQLGLDKITDKYINDFTKVEF
ncbi:MAG: hypothetical protein LBC09_07325 [Helicobacteraceae bacterium]|nr:hypothetical protein [Helicobacteraceae bacterium]